MNRSLRWDEDRQTGEQGPHGDDPGAILTLQPTQSPPRQRPADPARVFGQSLLTRQLSACTPDGSCFELPIVDWLAVDLPGDASLLARCTPPTLDVGCGPGRLAAALQTHGVHALGVDVSPQAVAHARSAGASAICRSVFESLPAEGGWESVLLADGNIGIGGDPVVLLQRMRALMSGTGAVYAEVVAPSRPTRRHRLRIDAGDGQRSAWFDWCEVSATDVAAVAGQAGLALTTTWTSHGRWFAELRPV